MEAAAREGTIDQTMKRLQGYPGVSTLNTQPWVLHFHSFITDEQADQIIKAAGYRIILDQPETDGMVLKYSYESREATSTI